MTKRLRVFVGSALLLLLAAGVLFHAPTQAQQGLRGPTTGLTWIPSAFQLMFGDITTSDIYLAKNGANVLGFSGNIGGAGSVANTTITPAAPYTWGTVALSGGTATVTFSKPYTVVPICIATDFTANASVKCAPTATTAVFTGTTTDVIQYVVIGNPN